MSNFNMKGLYKIFETDPSESCGIVERDLGLQQNMQKIPVTYTYETSPNKKTGLDWGGGGGG